MEHKHFFGTSRMASALFMAGSLLLAVPASSDVLTFTNLADWQNALAGAATLEDFESAIADDDFTGSTTNSPNSELQLSSVEESSFTNNALIDTLPFLSADGQINGNVFVSMRFLQNDSTPPDSVTVSFPAPLSISAFAFEYQNYDNQGDGASLGFTGTNGQIVVAFDSTTSFFGVVDTEIGATITSFTFTGDPAVGAGTSAFNSFDDVRYGTAKKAATASNDICFPIKTKSNVIAVTCF